MTPSIPVAVKRDAAQILRHAASHVQAGWTQGVTYNPVNRTCDILGAIALAGGCSRTHIGVADDVTLQWVPMARRPAAMLAYETIDGLLGVDPVEWNDARKRTKQQVINLLNDAAAALEASVA
jgi:hypothetical protein